MGFAHIDAAAIGSRTSASERKLESGCGHAALQERRVLKAKCLIIGPKTCGRMLPKRDACAGAWSLLPTQKGNNA
jgi:hypothetical protein